MEEPVKMLMRKRVNFKHLYVQNVPMLDHEDRSMQLLPLNPSVPTLQSWGAWRPAPWERPKQQAMPSRLQLLPASFRPATGLEAA